MSVKSKKPIVVRSVCAVALAVLCAVAIIWARNDPAGVLRVYTPWSRWISALLATVFSFTRFAVAEWLAAGLVVTGLVTLALTVRSVIVEKSTWPLLHWLSHAALTAVSLATFFFLVWGLNYAAPPLTTRLNIESGRISPQALYETAVWLRDEMNEWSDRVPRNESLVCDAGGFDSLRARAANGYAALAETSDEFDAVPKAAKRMSLYKLLPTVGLAGIFVPFTGESVVSVETIDAHLPFTICHEMAHRMGYAPEDEANFVAFLACVQNEDPTFVYSGYHLAFIYCSNALYAEDAQKYAALWETMAPAVRADIDAQNAKLKQYEGPAKDLGEAVNNSYLKAMDQPDGVKSYGRVVDLLIAEYQRRKIA